MKRILRAPFLCMLTFAACALGIALIPSVQAYADPSMPIVVSLGDSYASGEGIEPYYGQTGSNKYFNQDWIAHRSSQSWQSYLEFGGKTLGSVRAVPSSEGMTTYLEDSEIGDPSYYVVYDYSDWSEGNWFFAASSASYIENISDLSSRGYQSKGIQTVPLWVIGTQEYTAYLSPQIKAIDYVNQTYGQGSIDYVTITIGANDLDVPTIVYDVAVSSYSDQETLDATFEGLKQKYRNSVRQELIQMFNAVSKAAGSQAKIIFVGYPTVFDGAQGSIVGQILGLNFYFDSDEMQLIDDIMRWLDDEIHTLVLELNNAGMTNIYYVSLIDAFKGHGAYSLDNFILPMSLPAHTQDIDKSGLMGMISLSSLHPNTKGAKAMAQEAQSLIADIELVESGAKAHMPGWAYENGQVRFYESDGSMRTNAWIMVHGSYRYLGADGALAKKSWQYIDGAYYYFDASGEIVTDGWATYNGAYYYLGGDGQVVKNAWVSYNGKSYYLNANGNPVTNGWVLDGGAYSYMNASGNPVADDWVLYKGKYYYMDADGHPVTNDWVSYDGKRYYMDANGNPVVNGWVLDGDTYSYMDANGCLVADNWVLYKGKYYYMDAEGHPVTNGWVLYKGKYYYMDANGNPVVNAWVAYEGMNYYFDGSGVCVRSSAIQ